MCFLNVSSAVLNEYNAGGKLKKRLEFWLQYTYICFVLNGSFEFHLISLGFLYLPS